MTAEETKQWIDLLMGKTLKIHKQKKHHVSMSVCNVKQGEIITVYAHKNGIGKKEGETFHKSCLVDYYPEELYEIADYLDSLIEDTREEKRRK